MSQFDDNLLWYKDAVIYELHIKAFYDSTSDGIGDFQGLLQKLDYLQDLGVTAIWLLPFYPSPLKDDGYDIADYYSINPSYGNIDQFKMFLDEAHRRGLRVITELVINHTSDQHPWFQRARRAPKDSEERNYYVWTDDPNQYKGVRIIFQDFETSNWTWDPVAQQYYWHRFFNHQPDLNYDSPKVQEEVFRIIDYWCAMGVDGFRLDAVPYLYEREGTNGENLPETHAFLKKLRKHIDEKFPGTVFLAEANMWPEEAASYFGEGDECQMNYHFPVMPRMFMSLQREDRYPITDIFDQTPEIPDNCQWAMFLRNHDELTLEMVTDEERDFMYKVYAKDPKARINLGIRHRLAPLLDNNRRKIELMNSLLFSLAGTPVIYYGDEIGMGDNFYLGDRDGVRTPMQWSPDRNAGFSATNPQKLYLPVILDPQYHYESVNVETQRANTSSLFWFMKRLINMRKKYRAFGRGSMKFINVDNPKVLAFTRTYKDETILVVVNLSKYPQPAEVDLSEFKGYVPVEVFSKNKFPLIKENSPYFFTLDTHSFQWFELQKVMLPAIGESSLPLIEVRKAEDLFGNAVLSRLENTVLADYLPQTKWFLGRKRPVNTINIISRTPFPSSDPGTMFLLIEVSYESGLPELYQLPIAYVGAERSKTVAENCPQSVIARVRTNQEEGLLCDAFYITEVQQLLFDGFVRANARETLVFNTSPELQSYALEHNDIKPKFHGDYIHTTITYDNRFFLKMYRKVDRGVNPDVEITRFLTDEAKFEHTPALMGTLEWRIDRDNIVLGMMQIMIENHGDAQSFMLERLNNYMERILARDRSQISGYVPAGSLFDPVAFETLPDDLKDFLGGPAADQSRLLGKRTGELHLALASGTDKDFKPEEFSLHYQRSLFSAMQSLVRETYQSLSKNSALIPEDVQEEAKKLSERKTELLNIMKQIYARKLDVIKIRIHGRYILRQVLLTGKDLSIHDFSGNPLRPYSERRLKRSPLRDVAAMIRSFYYVAFESFLNSPHIQKEEAFDLLPFAELWAHYMSGFFVKAYLDTVKNSPIVPKSKEDLKIMLQTYLLENTLFHLNYELNYRPEWVMAPLRLIRSIIDPQPDAVKKEEVQEYASEPH